MVAIVTFAMRPVYHATSLLLIEPKGMNVAKVEGVYDPIIAGMALNDYYKTQFEILRSRRIIEPVATALKVPERTEFISERDPIEAFTNTIGVDPIRESRLVRVSVDSHDKAFATAAANAIVEQFVDESNQRTLGVSDTGLKKLKEMERALRPKYETAAKALQDFKDSNSIYFLDETQSIAVQDLRRLSEELSKARADRAHAAAEARVAGILLKDGKIEGPLPEFLVSKALDDLKIESARAEQDRDDLLKHYTKDHPAARAAEARVESVRRHLEEEQRAVLVTFEKKLASEDERAVELEAVVAKAEARVAEIGRKAVRLQFLKEEADTIAASYKNVARRIEEVEVSIATGTKENNLFVIDRALPPQLPVRPRKLLNISLGLVMGVLLGFGLCLLLEYLDQTIKGKEDAEALLGYPLLGFVPRVELDEFPAPVNGERVPIELIAMHQPRGVVAESFRTIRTGLAFTLPTSGPTPIVVTSAAPGDGKSFVAVNLAFSLAQTGKRVLLVDADLRRPRLHTIFGIGSSSVGLSNALAPGSDAGLPGVQGTASPTLDVLPAGPLPPNPAELLGGRAIRSLLDRALATYDWVVLDAPPLTAVADPAILLAQVPHALFVVRSFATMRGAVLRAKEILEKTPGAVAGIILNTADVPRGKAHGYYGYGGYDHYRSDGQPEKNRVGTTIS
jgi:capsular exopolysaccharide synthesis family protein